MQSFVAADYSDSTSIQVPFQNNSLQQASFAGIISKCSKMQKVFAVLERVAKTNSTVLILGESGTGKELAARAIHKLSGRCGRLVPVNCGAIPEEILESELFGHEKGAFTGAVANKLGRFQFADGGTIFLDEIGEMSPKLQVKLLRVLQEKKIETVGSTRSIDLDVRIVAATNKDLREEVKAGRFREDLFYRLQVVPVELPPLRERGSDIELLVEHFLGRSTEEAGRRPIEIDRAAMEALKRYSWPGNVRELENLAERLAILCDDEVRVEDLPEFLRANGENCQILEVQEEIPDDGLDFNELVNDYESKLILLALEKTGWNKKAAAELLSLNRTTLVEKIKKKGLEQNINKDFDSEPARPSFA